MLWTRGYTLSGNISFNLRTAGISILLVNKFYGHILKHTFSSSISVFLLSVPYQILNRDSADMLAAKRSVGVTPDVSLRGCVTSVKRLPTLALKPRRDITRSPIQVYQWPHKKGLCHPRHFLKIKKPRMYEWLQENASFLMRNSEILRYWCHFADLLEVIHWFIYHRCWLAAFKKGISI